MALIKEAKTLQELNLMDRFLFAEAADEPEFMETFLEILFDSKIQLKHPPQTEKEQRSMISHKQVRLDVWAEDENDVIYDAEPQQKDTRNLPKRSRYYQSLIDSSLLKPGTVNYNQLNDVYLIMIMSFDLFGKDRYQYTFRMTCQQDPNVTLQDGIVKIFLNTRGTNNENISQELVDMLKYFECTTDEVAKRSGSPRIGKLQKIVNTIRSSEEIGVKYMQAWEEKVMERQEGFEEGSENQKRLSARKLKERNIPLEIISEATGLSAEEIESL